MNNPIVSIIVPCYKVEQYIPNCIESVLNQTYPYWELVLVDDGSPDHSGEICERYREKDQRIRVVHKTNGGLSSARNAGLDIIRGEYVTFLDSDDFWHIDYLKIMMSYVFENNAEIVQCDFLRGSQTSFPEINQHESVRIYDNHSIFTEQAAKVIMWAKVYKSSLFEGVRMPVGLINEDDWTTWKLYYRAKKIVITNQALYYYSCNPNSIMANKQEKPDMTYFGAYEERIDFFTRLGETELVDVSRMQWCKSLLLLYANKHLTSKDKQEIKRLFSENWSLISHSAIVPPKLKMLFYGFERMPIVATITSRYRRFGGGKIKVSVVVPCYKVEHYLPNCIESVLYQSYPHWELILVDDGSPDHCGEIGEKYAAQDHRIHVLHRKNAGVAAARNAAIEVATGDFAFYLDGDDFLHKDCLKRLVHLAEQYQADIVQCGYVRGAETQFPDFEAEERISCLTNHKVFEADVAKIIVWGKLLRMDILKDIRIPEGRCFEDDLVTWKWYYAAEKIVVTSRPYYYYTFNEASVMAQHYNKPNFSFIDAYNERADFFRYIGERDMEDYSHRQLCKSMCLMYGNPHLTSQQKKYIKSVFLENWAQIRASKYISWKFKLLFLSFVSMPVLTTRFLKFIRKNVEHN